MRLLLLAGFALAQATAAVGSASAQTQPGVAVAAVADAPSKPRLRAELTSAREILSFGDLITGLDGDGAGIAAFRAPALGESGTIQVARIVESARAFGLIREAADLDTAGIAQVVVTRAARRIGASEIENAIKAALAQRHGLDARGYTLITEGVAPSLVVEAELTGEIAVQELSYDARSRNVGARLMLQGSSALRLKPARFSGRLFETVEVVVPLRQIARGEALTAKDVAVERRPREALSGDAIADIQGAVGRVARRALSPGLALRAGDVQRQEIVARGEIVTLVYEVPGIQISLRGRANEGGAEGDMITVVNPNSKRVLQGIVVAPGRIAVNGPVGGRVASAP